ncbi:MAG: hypothetical protein UR61_C0009G0013 [candidate division WS6 bacterium GW2011_GWE1_34_7]|uniref:Uncharacterized protein n=1 Tax=candidate division WS6 bacterium GW2011_GWE1_34_7 TaxID=1619093 RepID=A0A0G0BQH1_9BACT|nr:MAG: hypothetical protein UR61_C0009G0013 [candidate division WS6 bacterium GW2011_GWE1_34_7]
MAIEIKDPQFNHELYGKGAEAPIVVETNPSVTQVETSEGLNPANNSQTPIEQSLDRAVSEGRVGYDSPEIETKVLASSVTDAQSWNLIMKGKVQGAEIQKP